MNKLSIILAKSLRKLYAKSFSSPNLTKPECIQDPDTASKIISDILTEDKPCMIARYGSTELTCINNYFGVKYHQKEILNYIKNKVPAWWWEKKIINQMQQWSGFFPATEEKIEQFCELMIHDTPLVDILGSWLPEEKLFEHKLASIPKIGLLFFDPFWAQDPWTKALEGKKILVVHPFSQSIEQQYKKRKLLFKNNLLPEFDLKTLKAVQSIAGTKTSFKDWFEALDFMKSQIDNTDYDICLIGAGAYGFPLAAHVKRVGKKSFHLGGSLQLLFGIKGSRWENNYNSSYNYPKLFNEHWIRPGELEKPKNAKVVESACYW